MCTGKKKKQKVKIREERSYIIQITEAINVQEPTNFSELAVALHDWPGTGVVGAGCVMIGQEQAW